MFNNPYMNNYGFGMPMPQQPERQQTIQNVFTSSIPTSTNDYFMAKILKDNETSATQIVTQKTAFIDLSNKKLDIKDVNGDITSYEIILPKDAKDLKIEQLENELIKIKEAMANGYANVNATSNEITQPNDGTKKPNRK